MQDVIGHGPLAALQPVTFVKSALSTFQTALAVRGVKMFGLGGHPFTNYKDANAKN